MKKLMMTVVISAMLIQAVYAETKQPLLIGLIPEQNIFKQFERYLPLASYLDKKTGIKVKFTILSKYGDIIDRFTQRGLAGAFFGDLTGAIAIKKLAVEPAVTPINVYGSSTSYGFIIVRKDSGISGVEDMRGKIMAFVDKASVAGYLFPIVYLKKQGVKDYKTFFSEYYFTGGFDASLYDVVDGRADIGCVKNTVLNEIIRKDPSVIKEIKIIAQSPSMPTNVLCLSKTLSPEIKSKIINALLDMENDPFGENILKKMKFKRFIRAYEDNFLPVYRLLYEIHEKPETYDYKINDKLQ